MNYFFFKIRINGNKTYFQSKIVKMIQIRSLTEKNTKIIMLSPKEQKYFWEIIIKILPVDGV